MSAQPKIANETPQAYALGPTDGESIWFLDNLLTIKSSAATGARFSVMENAMPAGSHTPFHLHENEDEAFYVLEGKLRICVEDGILEAGPGTYVHLPAGTPHGFETLTAVRMLVLCGGEGFFEMVRVAGEPAPRKELPPVAPPDKERLQRACDQYAIRILGPLPH